MEMVLVMAPWRILRGLSHTLLLLPLLPTPMAVVYSTATEIKTKNIGGSRPNAFPTTSPAPPCFCLSNLLTCTCNVMRRSWRRKWGEAGKGLPWAGSCLVAFGTLPLLSFLLSLLPTLVSFLCSLFFKPSLCVRACVCVCVYVCVCQRTHAFLPCDSFHTMTCCHVATAGLLSRVCAPATSPHCSLPCVHCMHAAPTCLRRHSRQRSMVSAHRRRRMSQPSPSTWLMG